MIGFAQQHFFLFQVPIVQDVAHDQHVRTRKRIGKEASGIKSQSVRKTMLLDVFLEYRPHGFEIETPALEVRMRERYLNGKPALSDADINECLVFVPWKFFSDGNG